jgi:hypothetical protein
MSVNRLYSDIEYISAIRDRALSLGLELSVSTDFEELLALSDDDRELPPLYPMFNPAASFVSPENGFWIKGTNATGRIVHTQAMRLLDFGSDNLADHMRLHRLKYVLQGNTTEVDEKIMLSSPAANRITGKTVYHGQIWLRGGRDSYRGLGLSALLPRFALAISAMAWSPDFVFGFMDPKLACKGLLAQYGYAHIEPENWLTPDGTHAREQWLAWCGREDISHMMSFSPVELHDMLTKHEDSQLISATPLRQYQTV